MALLEPASERLPPRRTIAGQERTGGEVIVKGLGARHEHANLQQNEPKRLQRVRAGAMRVRADVVVCRTPVR